MWLLLILAYIAVGFGFFRIALKKTLNRIGTLPRSRKIVLVVWQFFFCLILSTVAFIVSKASGIESPITQLNYLWVAAATIGVFNAFAVYCLWCAIDVSLSKTSIGTQLDDAIAILIGYFGLGEAKIFGWQLFSGVALCFAAALTLVGFKKDSRDLRNWQLVKYVLGYSFIWGVANASFRFFNLKDLPLTEFLICWYTGSTLGAALIIFFKRTVSNEKIDLRLSQEDKREVPILSVCIWVSLLIEYLVADRAEVSIYQPLLLVGEAVLPTFIGLYYFREKKELKTKEWIAIILGFIGAILVGARW